MLKRISCCCLIITMIACSKENSTKTASLIEDVDVAKVAVAHIESIANTMFSGLRGKNREIKDSTVNGIKGGSLLVNAIAHATKSGSANSTLETKEVDAFLRFDSYEDAAVSLNGSMQYYYYDYYRMACSSSACASSAKTNYSYTSKYAQAGQTAAVEHPIAISFVYKGQLIKDTIYFSVYISTETAKPSIKVTTGAGKSFAYSY